MLINIGYDMRFDRVNASEVVENLLVKICILFNLFMLHYLDLFNGNNGCLKAIEQICISEASNELLFWGFTVETFLEWKHGEVLIVEAHKPREKVLKYFLNQEIELLLWFGTDENSGHVVEQGTGVKKEISRGEIKVFETDSDKWAHGLEKWRDNFLELKNVNIGI